ncbi:hypothetical protein ACG83_24035 [Frankia sp. R43]|uniref:hypothetical protein n=1 Tax=Frankia sp. R43 TaxID=269536 RepID=UPI0006D95417|nr:hypothetical protein [Frankia sp. R43]KPM53682.1 hypothetical protein ACG83_24035 [Frankia sp. R43]
MRVRKGEAWPRRQTSWCRYELWRDGRLVQAELEPFTLQIWDLDEFDDLLQEAGLTTVAVHADYKVGQSPTAGTGVWTFEATNRAGR